jgi:hypothetical protein
VISFLAPKYSTVVKEERLIKVLLEDKLEVWEELRLRIHNLQKPFDRVYLTVKLKVNSPNKPLGNLHKMSLLTLTKKRLLYLVRLNPMSNSWKDLPFK